MRKILIFILLLASLSGFSQFDSPIYHKLRGDTLLLLKTHDSLWEIKLNASGDTLSINGRKFAGGGGSGGGGITDITYDQLLSAISGKTLSKGDYYKLTDYKTVHYYVDGTTRIDTAINAGNVEPLVLFATSDSSIDKNVYSFTFPNDIIYYDPDSTHFITDISFSDGSTMVAGFKGVITYRYDTKQDNYTYYDFRNVKFRRWAIIPDSLVMAIQAVDTSSTPYQSWQSTLPLPHLTVNANRWYDYYTFGDYYSTAKGCHIEAMAGTGYDQGSNNTILNNIVFITANGGFLGSVGIGQHNFNETFLAGYIEGMYFTGESCSKNIFAGSIEYLVINGNDFYSNTIGNNFSFNTIGSSFLLQHHWELLELQHH